MIELKEKNPHLCILPNYVGAENDIYVEKNPHTCIFRPTFVKTLKKRKLQTPTYIYFSKFKNLLVKLIRGVDHICDLFPLQFFDKI